MANSSFEFHTIGLVTSPYKEKFAVPKQPGLVPQAEGYITLVDEFNQFETVKGLEHASHIWLLFCFHQNIDRGWQASVRPPRLGGNAKMGVFATRATHRPNPIGMSVVELISVEDHQDGVRIHVRGLDLVDGTPILDIKPHVPYSDNVEHSQLQWVEDNPLDSLDVTFTSEAEAILKVHNKGQQLRSLIEGVLAQDPRPAYQRAKSSDREYGVKLENTNVRWRVAGATVIVTAIENLD